MSLRPLSWRMDVESELYNLLTEIMEVTGLTVDEALQVIIETAQKEAKEINDA